MIVTNHPSPRWAVSLTYTAVHSCSRIETASTATLDVLVRSLQDFGGTPPGLEFKFACSNSATFFRPSSGLLCHTYTEPGVIKSWIHSGWQLLPGEMPETETENIGWRTNVFQSVVRNELYRNAWTHRPQPEITSDYNPALHYKLVTDR
jgi:hypothetical protein